MLTRESGLWLAAGGWFVAIAAIVACSVAVGASWSASALLVLVCSVPPGVAVLISRRASLMAPEGLYAGDGPKAARR